MNEDDSTRIGRRQPFGDDWTFSLPRGVVAKMRGEQDVVEPVRLPHDAMRDSRSPDALSGPLTAYHVTASYRYEKKFFVPEGWRQKVVQLEFEGVYRDARVFVNDVLAAQHSNGYTGFTVPADAFLHFGEENTIVVEARTHLDGRWYTGGGIYRPVYLHVLDAVHIAPSGIAITTPEVDSDFAVVSVSTDVVNASRHTRTVELQTSIRGADGAQLTSNSTPVTLLPGQRVCQVHRLGLDHPALWDVDSPFLHTVLSTLVSDDTAIDEIETAFGIRTLRLDSAHGLRINGREVALRGGAIHHDNGPLGAATIDRAEERRVEILKAAGFNAIRSAHNPASRALLDACDRLGMLVINEAFDVWTRGKNEFDYSFDFADHWRDDVTEMVHASRNHPSVIMYSIGNEVLEIVDAHGANQGRQLANHIRSLDPTRYITNALQLMWLSTDLSGAGAVEAMNELLGEPVSGQTSVWAAEEIDRRIHEFADVLDLVGYNYADARFAVDRERFPHRVVYGSETFPTRIASYWKEVSSNAHVVGDFTWTAWDYIGEVGVGAIAYEGELAEQPGFLREYPHLVAQVGDIDITGNRRPISYYREIVFGRRTEPYISVQTPARHGLSVVHQSPWAFTDGIASWSWEGHEGAPVTAHVYADADEVALLLNGEELGREPVGRTRAFEARFDVRWSAGMLTAVAYRAGRESGRFSLRSARGPVLLGIDSDRPRLRADDSDLAYVSITIHDGDGNLWVDRDRQVTLTIDGPATLIGYGTSDPATSETFGTPTRTTFQGRALAILRPAGTGTVTVTARSADLQPASVDIRVDRP
jgi:hypothetical protein